MSRRNLYLDTRIVAVKESKSIFGLFKTSSSPGKLLRDVLRYVPGRYRTSEHYKDAVEFLEHREWGLALETLIELTEESVNSFSENYWNGLTQAAEQMQMKKEAEFCRNQITKD